MVVKVLDCRSPLLAVAPQAGPLQVASQGHAPLRVVRLERTPARAHGSLGEAGVVRFEPSKVGREASVARPVGD